MGAQTREARFDVDELLRLVASHRPLQVRYAADELICRQGSFAAGLQWVAQGLVLEFGGDSGKGALAAAVDFLLPGDALGIEILIPGAEERHRTTCRALTEVTLVFIDRESLDRALDQDPGFASLLVAHLASRYDRLRHARLRRGWTPTARLEATLLDLRPICESMGDSRFALPAAIDSRVLADLSGISPAQMRRVLDVVELDHASGRLFFHMEAPSCTPESPEARKLRASLG
jgi:CRP-like cAMP-binding protein